jgi:hypothetical protein
MTDNPARHATADRLAFIERLRAADCSWDQTILVALAHTSANEIERLSEIVGSLRADLEGAAHNRFYDQRDAYFDGVDDGRHDADADADA